MSKCRVVAGVGCSLIVQQYIEAMRFRRLLSQLPGSCAICRGWDRGTVCTACTTRFAQPLPRCARCAIDVPDGVAVCGSCLVDPPAFDAAWSGVSYGYPWDGLVAKFKFESALELTSTLADRLLDARRLASAPSPDLLLPVPLGRARLRQRGFNQAWELARVLSRELGVRADPRLLQRVRETAQQRDLPLPQRRDNVRGSFAVDERRRDEVSGRHIAVVDDVMTSGATLGEIARVLKEAGAKSVDVWVVARTPRPGTA
jgi:ComF family protein